MTRNFAAKAVHKYMYPATYNFRDDANGAVPSGWTDTSGGTTSATVITSLDGHRKVLKLYDGDGAARAVITTDITQGLNTVVEMWMTKDSIAANTVMEFRFFEGATVVILCRLAEDDIDNYTGGAYASIKDNFLVVNTLTHFKFVLDDTANTYDLYIDGVLEGNDVAYNANSTSGIDSMHFRTDNADTGYNCYIDAVGFSTDTDYAIGDNCYPKHLKESAADTLEEDDVGTQGTSIMWVDGVNTADDHEIIAEYNEHKKILRTYRNSGTGVCYHTFASQSTAGWVAGWVKVADADDSNGVINLAEDANLRIKVQIDNDRFEYDAGAGMVTAGVSAVDATWYFVYLQWYADDTFDLWVNNVQYLDGVSTFANFTGAGINRFYIYQNTASPATIYLDAPISSLDSDSRADNRIFDYNDAYTREDITTATQNVVYSNVLHGWRTATLYSKNDYDHDRVFLQIYDINSILALEAEIINRVQKSEIRTYTLLDKNYDDLKSLSSNTFSADDLHDPTDSTSMLKTVLPNVSEIDGDLILVNADTKTDTYSTVTKNYPDGDFLRDISDLADSCVIIEANGKCHLDDDLASGDSLDFDTAADHSKMTGEPKVNDILDTINYFEIFGAINPDTGERFYKITDNSGDDRKRKWRITNNSFRNQTDLDAYAAKLVAKLVSVKEITINVQGLGAHNMGTLFTYKYDNDIYTIPTAAYYVISESIDFDTAAATILLSEGIIESSKYAAGFEKPQNYQDTYASEIYETDIITVYPESYIYGAATKGDGAYITANAVGEGIRLYFPVPSQVDDSRDVIFHFYWQRGDANNDTVTVLLYVGATKTDGTEVKSWNVENGTGDTLAASAVGARYQTYNYTLAAADYSEGDFIEFCIDIREIRTLYFFQPSAVFYIKRSV